MQLGATDAIDLGPTFRAGSINYGGTALVKVRCGVLNHALGLALDAISFNFHEIPPKKFKSLL